MKKKRFWGGLALVGIILSFATFSMAGPPGTWTTDYTLFNVGTGTATYSMTRYNLCSGSGCPGDTGTDFTVPAPPNNTIPQGGSFYYNPGDPQWNFPTFSGSVVISSDQPLAGTVTLANGFSGSAYASDAYSAVDSLSAATSVITPIIMAGLGTWNTRISIQNTSGTANADVQVVFSGTNKPADVQILGLPPNMTAWVDQVGSATDFNGSAKITSAQPLAVIVEEYKTTGGVLVAYNGLPASDSGTTVYMPGYIDQGIWATDFTLVETSGVAATATVTFSGSGNTLTGPVPANGSVYLNRYSTLPSGWTGTFPTGYYGGSTITATGGSLVSVYNISNSGSGGPGNLAIGYTGFNATKAKPSVVVPLIENAYGAGGWTTTYTVQSVDGTPANLTMTYNGNLTPICNPCTSDMAGKAAFTFNQGAGGDNHVPVGFLGGVTVASDKNIVVIADQNSPTGSGDTAAGFVGM